MSKRRQGKIDPFANSSEAVKALQHAQWQFGATTGTTVYELRIILATPGVFPPAKADIPLPGLPTLDGFLSFVAFRAALKDAIQSRPDLIRDLLWQWNAALRNPDLWIDFELPIREVKLNNIAFYDCSVGVPIINGQLLVPTGAFFVEQGLNFKQYPEIVDSIPLRRRVVEPMGKRLVLRSTSLNVSSGKNKALNNRMYYALTSEYLFYFRGDIAGVARLLSFARDEDIGIGKKTSLGYGRISSFTLQIHALTDAATLALPVLDGGQRALLKAVPYQLLLSQREQGLENKLLLGCERFRLGNALETVGSYRPPYWRRESQTQILQYGSILLER